MSPEVGTFETCQPALLMSVHQGRPEVIGRGSKRRFFTQSGHAYEDDLVWMFSVPIAIALITSVK
jgi:hypothetical protein